MKTKQYPIQNPDAPATSRQTFALFCIYKKDYRDAGLTRQQASDLIASAGPKQSVPPIGSTLPHNPLTLGAVLADKQRRQSPFAAILADAHAAGMKAGDAVTPEPMVVAEADGLSDRAKPGGKSWFVADGVCGFAWIVVNPARGPFITYCKANKIGDKEYGGGWCVKWVGEFNQSMQRKEQYATAFAAVLQKHGINAHTRSRMD